MTDRYIRVYSHAELMSRSKKEPWPETLFKQFERHAENAGSRISSLWFDCGSAEEAAFLGEVNRLGLRIATARIGRCDPKKLDSFPYYWLGVRGNSEGFEGDEIYERQRPCGQPPSPGHISVGWGCGEGKRQIRKLRVMNPRKVSKDDIFKVFTLPIQPEQRVFGITSRLRNSLVQEGLTGFELTPILDGRTEWTPEQLTYAHIDEDQVAQAEWFQMTVTARTAEPLAINSLRDDRVCPVCHFHAGWDEPDLSWAEFPRKAFAETDIQIADWRRLPTGEVIVNRLSPLLFASAKFMRLVIEHKVRGIVSRTGPWGRFAPVTLSDDT